MHSCVHSNIYKERAHSSVYFPEHTRIYSDCFKYRRRINYKLEIHMNKNFYLNSLFIKIQQKKN